MPHSIQWLGHAACRITSEKGVVVLIDPWITGNPSCPVKKEDIKRADIILVTHDHSDHLGSDIPYLVNATGAMVIAQPELAGVLNKAGVKSGNIINGIGMNIGGQVEVAGVRVVMTQAFHSGTAGEAVGYIVILEDGKTVYHAGDTGIFSDMELLAGIYGIDLALLPIGSVFVMDPVQAAFSLTMLKPGKVIPIHYGTFPVLVQDPAEFIRLAGEKAPATKVEAIKPGQEVFI